MTNHLSNNYTKMMKNRLKNYPTLTILTLTIPSLVPRQCCPRMACTCASPRYGKPLGHYHERPFLNTRVYDVMFHDGSIEQFAANTIAENTYSQVDEEGYRYQLIDSIIDHRKTDAALLTSDVTAKTKTTKGWFMLVQWKDGTQSWKPLKDIKQSNPVDVAIYAKEYGLVEQQAFAWWVSYTIKKKTG